MSESARGAFDAPLEDELAQVASDRVNARASVVTERYAALRWSLDREDRNHCDGYATDATPGVEAGKPVEVKACKVRHQCPDGSTREGRFSAHLDSHGMLEEDAGRYAIAVYETVDTGGSERVIVLAADLVEADEVGRLLPAAGRSTYQKVRWSRVIDADVDESRWSR